MTTKQFLFYLSITLFFIIIISCKDKITDPFSIGGNVICYEKSYNGHWEIFTSNITGSNPQNISNYSGDDEYPQWSPDGRYIVYSRRGMVVAVYDTKNKSNTILTSDTMQAGQMPGWMPNGKIYFTYRGPFWASPWATYIMNPDGSDKRKILDLVASIIYFYSDNYTFLYVVDWTKVYKTNIDSTLNEFIVDINAIQGFNPYKEELLISQPTTDGIYVIGTYSIRTKNLVVLLTAEEGYTFSHLKYSKDYSKIALIEHSDKDEYLSVLENGVKKRLVRIPASSPPVYFSYQPMEFSPDGRYIAFSEQIFHSGQWVSFSTPLFIVDILDGALRQLDDEAHCPSWNPRP